MCMWVVNAAHLALVTSGTGHLSLGTRYSVVSTRHSQSSPGYYRLGFMWGGILRLYQSTRTAGKLPANVAAAHLQDVAVPSTSLPTLGKLRVATKSVWLKNSRKRFVNIHLQNVSMRILMRRPGCSWRGRGNHKSRNQLTMLCVRVCVCAWTCK